MPQGTLMKHETSAALARLEGLAKVSQLYRLLSGRPSRLGVPRGGVTVPPSGDLTVARAKAREGVLTNMHIDLDYEAVAAETPAHIRPAFDGMVLELAAP